MAFIMFGLVPLIFTILLVITTKKIDKWRRKKEDERIKEVIKKAIKESEINSFYHKEDTQ